MASKLSRRQTEAPKRILDRFTVNLPQDLIEETRDAVVALSGPPHLLTLSAFTVGAFKRELARLRKNANRGRAFPRRAEGQGPRRGRPIGSGRRG